MKILLVSGFLGAGKTSVIKHLSERTAKKFVIIENEFADEDIDSSILKSDSPELEIMSISEGCICCSMNLSFAHSVMTVANSLNPDYLIVEPSGVARPQNIIDELSKIVYERISLLVPILIVDGNNYKRAFDEFSELYGGEILDLSRVFVSKSENFYEEDFARIRSDLNINSDNFLNRHYSKLSDTEIDHILADELVLSEDYKFEVKEKESDRNFEIQNLKSLSLTNIRDISPGEMAFFLERVMRKSYGDIIRSKGVFKDFDNYYRYELVEGDYIIGGFEKTDTKMVFIGKEIEEDLLRDLLDK